jgi:hypothetical protein
MADVSAVGGSDAVGPGDGGPADPESGDADDRAQLLLVAGLVIAVTFVVLALTLNTVIYTENLATRSSDIAGGDDSIRFLEATEDGIAGILGHANRNHNDSHAAVRQHVTDDVDAWRNAIGRSFSLNGVVTNVSNRNLTNGTRMLQTDGSRDFSAADGSANWTLASNASATRQFRLNVTNASLTNSEHTAVGLTSEVFHVHFNDGSSRHRMFVYRDTTVGTVNVTVVTNGSLAAGSDPCSASGANVFVNVTAGTVGGESCSALSFVSDLQGPYAITYNKTDSTAVGETANGTYHLIVDDESVAESPGPQFNDGPGVSPWADAAIYAMAYDAVYETDGLRYDASVRVAPGEADG